MRVLVINAGSSSVKFSVFDMGSGATRCKHEVEIESRGFDAAMAEIPATLAQAGDGFFRARHRSTDPPVRRYRQYTHPRARGFFGQITQTDGLIVAQHHIHMKPEEAHRLGIANRDIVEVDTESPLRTIAFRDVAVRIDPDFALEMHIDTDEANAAAIAHGGAGELMSTSCHARVTASHPDHHNFPKNGSQL